MRCGLVCVTTLAGLAVMQERGFRDILRDTVLAATARSRELAQR